jgi:hypothetical protein
LSGTWIKNYSNKYIEQVQRLDLFDCGIWMGKPEGFPLAAEKGFKELKEEMKDFYINGALLSHWRGKTLSAQDGNRSLEEKSGLFSENMYSIWTGLPLYPEPVASGPIPGIGRPNSSMRGVRIFPTSHNFITEEWVIGTLCQWLYKHKIPLFVMHTEISWTSLYRLATLYPELTIVLETQTKKILYHTRVLFPLMRECPNIMVETSNFAGQGYIEYVVREFGAGRLVFGSFMPVNDPFVPIGMIINADIKEQEKLLIASGNIKRIIEGMGR